VSHRALAAICIAALALGTAGAMVITQRLRSEGPVAVNIRLKTKPDERYRACLRPTRDDRFSLAMVDTEERVVKLLVPDAPLTDDEARCFDWDGTGDDGQPVAPGVYRLRLTLNEADREVISGERLTIPPQPANP
jgi:hypothetical protein